MNVFLAAADLKEFCGQDVLFPGQDSEDGEFKRRLVSKAKIRDLYDYMDWPWIEEDEDIDPANGPPGEENIESWGDLTIHVR